MECEHNDQRPDRKRRVWVCAECGEDTVPFYTPEERTAIAAEEAEWNRKVKAIVS